SASCSSRPSRCWSCWARLTCRATWEWPPGSSWVSPSGRAASAPPPSAGSPTTGDCHPPSGSPRSRPCSAVSSPSPCPSRARVEEITRVTILHHFQDGEQVLLIDQRGKRYLLLLRKGETFHCDRGWIHHETIIGQPDGAWVRTSKGTRCLAIRPTLAEYVLDMPRGAQVISRSAGRRVGKEGRTARALMR